MDAMTRIFAMRSYTPFYKNPKNKTKRRRGKTIKQKKERKKEIKKNEKNNIEFPLNQLLPKLKSFNSKGNPNNNACHLF